MLLVYRNTIDFIFGILTLYLVSLLSQLLVLISFCKFLQIFICPVMTSEMKTVLLPVDQSGCLLLPLLLPYRAGRPSVKW